MSMSIPFPFPFRRIFSPFGSTSGCVWIKLPAWTRVPLSSNSLWDKVLGPGRGGGIFDCIDSGHVSFQVCLMNFMFEVNGVTKSGWISANLWESYVATRSIKQQTALEIKSRSTASAQLSTYADWLPNIKVVGQTVQPWECPQTDGRTDGRTHLWDATKYIISLASRSIKIRKSLWDMLFLGVQCCRNWESIGIYSWDPQKQQREVFRLECSHRNQG